MLFYSLTNPNIKADFETALMQGLAPDGGLYFPEKIPKFTEKELGELPGKSLQEIGILVLEKFLEDSLTKEEIETIIGKSLTFKIPLVDVLDNKILEIFHGPTMAFKDVAGQTLANLMGTFLAKRNEKAIVLVATSGDTGGAIANGYASIPNIKVVILYPKGKVSKLQEEQLTRVDENVFPVEIDGDFDSCQKYVKQAFVDENLKDIALTSANSINIGRLIPQIIYYVHSYAQNPSKNMEFFVPSGNFGNLSGAIIAKEMGIPIQGVVACLNENDTVLDYYNTGIFEPKPSVRTLSNAMDIGNPSNFARILKIMGYDHQEFRNFIRVAKVSDKETIETMKKVFDESGYLLEPHTAVAWTCAEKIGRKDSQNVIVATACPEKFAEEILENTGIFVDNSKEIQELQKKEKRKIEIEDSYENVKKVLLEEIE